MDAGCSGRCAPWPPTPPSVTEIAGGAYSRPGQPGCTSSIRAGHELVEGHLHGADLAAEHEPGGCGGDLALGQVSELGCGSSTCCWVPAPNDAAGRCKLPRATREDIDTAATAGSGPADGAADPALLHRFSSARAPLYRPARASCVMPGCSAARADAGSMAPDQHHGCYRRSPTWRLFPAEVALIRDPDGVLDELASQITAAGISAVPKPSARDRPGHRGGRPRTPGPGRGPGRRPPGRCGRCPLHRRRQRHPGPRRAGACRT